ncbi:Uma2 family endonuclease [Streptomyces sp. NPDC059378]|uniref:Uma2 family endonuclease n=1 Tax=Streptomyces sp. NPDC059378 TaxID=3346815 RepID=UPI0036CD2078
MRALTVSEDPEQSWDDLVRFWEEMEWPEGSKVEIVEGIINVSPVPAVRHNVIAARIQRRLYSVIPDDWGIYQTMAIAVPSRMGMLIPDLVVTPRPDHREADSHIRPEGPTVTLYGDPKGDVYRPLSTAKFGEAVKLPAPFDLVIGTTEFPVA